VTVVASVDQRNPNERCASFGFFVPADFER
jgi:hypothetical protein